MGQRINPRMPGELFPSSHRFSTEKGKPVRVLVIDDSPDDRSLVVHELRREVQHVDLIEITSPEELAEALDKAEFDAVITDYQLQWTNGIKVLQQVKSISPETPVIMFTGTGSEEVAVEGMKLGLDDYVLKSPRVYGRLSAALQMALKTKAHKHELLEAETRYKALFDTVPVGLFRCNPSGEILDANQSLATLLGFANRTDLLHTNFQDLHIDENEFSHWREMLERQGSVAFIESKFRARSGAIRWVEIHAKALRDLVTKEIFYEGGVEDVTERKEVEEDRENLITELQLALARVKTLTGLLPICSSCKKIRDSDGTWNNIELYIQNHSQAQFTHGFCPDCVRKLYPEVFVDRPIL